MGNSSSRRRRTSSAGMYPPPPPLPAHQMYPPQLSGYAPPPGPVSYTPYVQPYSTSRFPMPVPYHSTHSGGVIPPAGPHFYPPTIYSEPVHYQYSYPPSNGYWMHTSNAVAPICSQPAPMIEPSATMQQQTITVRNDVNIQKGTIRLEKDEKNPGFYLLAFSFDADAAGSFSIFLFSKEGPDCSLVSSRPEVYKPVHIPFEKGLGQKFFQESGTGLNLDAFDASELEKEWPDEVCPLAIRAQTFPKESEQDMTASPHEGVGDPLPKSVNSQITQAVIQKKDKGGYDVRVLRQIIWVNGVRYELQEIYGIESAIGEGEFDENDLGKECVICMSEPRDTAVMPCRHMCMCNGCAALLRSKMNRCPICRQHVQTLLRIKV